MMHNNVVDNLIKKTKRLDRSSHKYIASVLEEITNIETTIHTILDIVIHLQNTLSDLIILQIEFIIPHEEKSDIERETHPQDIINYITDIISVFSMADSLGNVFDEFNSQTSTITDIYTPYTFSDTAITINEQRVARQKIIEKKILEDEIRTDITKENIYAYFKESAQTIDALETLATIHDIQKDNQRYIRDSIHYINGLSEYANKISTILYTEILDTKDLKKDIAPYNIAPYKLTENLYQDILGTQKIVEISKDYSEIEKRTSSTIQKIISETYENVHISDIYNLENRQDSDILNIQKIIEISKDFSEIEKRTSSTIHKIISDTYENTHISDIYNLENRQYNDTDILKDIENVHSESLKINPKSEFVGQNIIEIPTFKQHEKPSILSGYTTIDTLKFSDKTRNNEKDIAIIDNTSISPSSNINTFSMVSDYITIISDVNGQINELMNGMIDNTMEYNENINKIIEPIEDIQNIPFIDKIILREQNGDIVSEELTENVLNTTESAITESLQKTGFSLLKNMIMATNSSEHHKLPVPISAISAVHKTENLLHVLSGERRDTSPFPIGSKSINFYNNFNISVNVKGGIEDTELKGLGKKIGQILSDELKRYGGI